MFAMIAFYGDAVKYGKQLKLHERTDRTAMNVATGRPQNDNIYGSSRSVAGT